MNEATARTQRAGRGRAGINVPALPLWAHRAALAPALALIALIGAYWIVAYHPGSLAYVDYVDGYYLYVVHRMAQGAVLYRQIMGVQPPGIYLVGDALFRLHDSLAVARWYAAALHSVTVLLVFAAGLRLYGSVRGGLVAAVLYSLAPYSLVWSRTFDPNPLVTCLSLATFVALLGGTRRGAGLAGLIGALALATKIWYVPVAAAMLLFLARHRRDLCRPYAATLLACTALILALGTLSAGGAFWRGLLVQDASGLSASWLLAAVFDVVQRDWPLLVLAGAGLATARRAAGPAARQDDGDIRRFARWYLWASALVLGATIKVGTFAPVFQFAEPALALVAAGALAPLLGPEHEIAVVAGRSSRRGGRLLACAMLLVMLLWTWPAVGDVRQQSDASVRAVLSRIARASASGSSLLAPPFYLYLSQRREIGEYADVNLWALADARGDAVARALTRRTVAALRHRAIPLVLLDNRVARLPGVVSALRAGYHRLPFADPLPAVRAVPLWAPGTRWAAPTASPPDRAGRRRLRSVVTAG